MKTLLIAAAVLSGMAASQAAAATVLDTGQPAQNTPGFNSPGTNVFGGNPSSGDDYVAVKFSLGATTTLTEIQGFIGNDQYSPATNNLLVAIYRDGGTGPFGGDVPLNAPGGQLLSASFTATNPIPASWQGVDVDWTLDAGDYWVAFQEAPGGYGSSAMATDAPDPAPSAFWNGSNWYATSSDSIGVRIFSADLAPAPEPAGWMMMIAGLGLVGVAARRRRRQAWAV